MSHSVEPTAETSGRPAWLIPVAAFLCFSIAGGMMYVFLRDDKAQIGPAFARTLADPAGDMTIVSAGPVRFGPQREEFILPSFYIDNAPVTCRAYAAFAQATQHPLPAGFSTAQPADAVRGISYADAQAFAAWAHKRLPDAREWEKAREKLHFAAALPEWTAPWPAGAQPEPPGGGEPAGFRCARDPQ
jgi:hypothetical protein